MSKRNPRLLGIAWAIIVLVFVTCMFTVSFFLTAYIYKIANLNPPALLAQIVNSLLGLFFTGMMIGGVTQFARSRGWVPEMNVFAPIIEAMQKIAKGDFSVRLDNTFRENELAGVLVKSMNDMALELNEMEKMRQEFISNVSHEIQSPLTSIRGFAQALENDRLSTEERRRYLAIIEAESTRLSRITDNLLKLASLESKQLKFEPKPYRLDKQIRNLILACEPQWAGKGIDLDVSLEEVEISADEDLLSQVWINLIYNSIKFTPDGGKVCIELRRQQDDITFKITDTGIGIAEENQPRVFERFYKEDESRTRSNGGSGLGLAIAKTIIEMHKGTIGVQSILGAGSTFTVGLPLKS
jgi:two-component system, OmpR family, phosphate regulon sensor histidine kinase PhoR